MKPSHNLDKVPVTHRVVNDLIVEMRRRLSGMVEGNWYIEIDFPLETQCWTELQFRIRFIKYQPHEMHASQDDLEAT